MSGRIRALNRYKVNKFVTVKVLNSYTNFKLKEDIK